MLIGIFGGSFNPIHNGHIAIAQYALQTAIDEVWFVVSPHNPLKEHSALLDDALRLTMVEHALRGKQGMVCCDEEYRLPQPSYMCNTLCTLAAQRPTDTFALLIGADNWLAFPRWRNSDYILAHHDIYIYPRQGYTIAPQTLPPQGVVCLDMPLLDISATQVRQRLAAGSDISTLVPAAVVPLLHNYYRP